MQAVASDTLVGRLILLGMTQSAPRANDALRTQVPTAGDFVHPRCELASNQGIHDEIVTLQADD